jgi:hypothetical protein
VNDDGPGPLLAELSVLLGRTPTEEVLLVTDMPSHALTGSSALVGIPLPTHPDAAVGMLYPACVTAVQWIAGRGARHLVIVVYAADAADPDGIPTRTAATLNVLAESARLTVIDTLRVVDGRWWSYECEDPSCCPPEGTPIPTPEENPA